MKIYDAFPTKTMAQKAANDMRKQGVQFVRVKKVSTEGPRLKYGLFLGGRGSGAYV